MVRAFGALKNDGPNYLQEHDTKLICKSNCDAAEKKHSEISGGMPHEVVRAVGKLAQVPGLTFGNEVSRLRSEVQTTLGAYHIR